MRNIIAAFLVFIIYLGSACAGPGVEVSFKLSPAGGFVASSPKILGSVVQMDGGFKGDGIEVPLSFLKTGLELRDEHMKNKYLEIQKYPVAKVIHAEGKDGKGKALIEIHGVQKEVEGLFQVEGKELTAQFPLKISDFNINKVKYLGVGVNDVVQVVVRVPVK